MTYHHPEGITHPRAPAHKILSLDKSARRGWSWMAPTIEKKIVAFLKKEKRFCSHTPVFLQIRKYIHQKEDRQKYVAFALHYLKNKKQRKCKERPCAIIGAGAHSALFIYHQRMKNPKRKFVLLEKHHSPASTFQKLGAGLVLNSPTYPQISLDANIFPGHFVQLSDFDTLGLRPFPTAEELYQLITMIFFHADATILFEHEVKRISPKDSTLIQIDFKEKSLEASAVILAEGKNKFLNDTLSHLPIYQTGDQFIEEYIKNPMGRRDTIKGKKIALIGDGDTANCVAEFLLPLIYPHVYYQLDFKNKPLPQKILWFGQKAKDVQDFYFKNKSRYCHSGALIEYFWNQESPFEISTEVWQKTKGMITLIPDKYQSYELKNKNVLLKTLVKNKVKKYLVDLIIDARGRHSPLFDASFSKASWQPLRGDITFHGGHWCEHHEKFIPSHLKKEDQIIALKHKRYPLYAMGMCLPWNQFIDSEEAKDGSLKYNEEKITLTNSKWSLEHILPRTQSFALIF